MLCYGGGRPTYPARLHASYCLVRDVTPRHAHLLQQPCRGAGECTCYTTWHTSRPAEDEELPAHHPSPHTLSAAASSRPSCIDASAHARGQTHTQSPVPQHAPCSAGSDRTRPAEPIPGSAHCRPRTRHVPAPLPRIRPVCPTPPTPPSSDAVSVRRVTHRELNSRGTLASARQQRDNGQH
jgi:hypothetical protein